jgi:predicted TIM-barrel fold metal-dependent hydrolase
MNIIDAQVHAYEVDSPQRPWKGDLPGPRSVTGDELVHAMQEVGVDRALLITPWSLYGSDNSYIVEVWNDHPDRFGLVAPIDPHEHGAAAAVLAWGDTPGAVGIRLMAGITDGFSPDHADVRAAVRAAVAKGLPVCVFCPRRLWIIEQLARLYPDAQFVLDHLGLVQPLRPPAPDQPFAELGDAIALASLANIAIKVTGMCTLSRRPFPFDDLREPLTRVLEAFGVDRCMWGTDWTRAVELVSYADAVAAFRDHFQLLPAERDALMGGTVEKLFGWPRRG